MYAACFAQDVVGRWKLDDGTAIVEIYKSEGIVPQQGGPATPH